MARHRRTLEDLLADAAGQNRANAGVAYSTPAMTPIDGELILPNAIDWDKLHPEVQTNLSENTDALAANSSALAEMNDELAGLTGEVAAATAAAAAADQKGVDAAAAAVVAQSAATAAQTAANNAASAASTADAKAVAAQSKANKAEGDAATAKGIADGAASAGAAADGKAVVAQAAADNARIAANKALASSGKSYRRTGTDAVGIVTSQSLTPSPMVSVASDGAPGGFALQKTTAAGNNVYDTSAMQDFNPDLLYRISFKVRVVTAATNGAKVLYAGILALKADGTTGVSTTGTSSWSSAHYFAASNTAVPADGQWRSYVGYFKGHSDSSNGGLKPLPTAPGTIHTATRKIMPLAFLDYSGGDGVWEVGAIELDVISPEGVQALVDAGAADQKARDAAGAATEASALANAIVKTATTDATGTPPSAGALWNKVSADGSLIIKTWTANAGGTAWVERKLDDAVIGNLNAATINAGILNADRLNATDVRAKFISAGKVTASDMVASTLTSASGVFGVMDASVINAGTLNAARLNAGDVRAKFIEAGKITAADITAGTLTSASGVFGTIDASAINAGTLNAARLNATDVRAKFIAAGKVTAADMVAGTLTSASGVFGTLDASIINAGTLNVARLNGGDVRAAILTAGKITATDMVAGTLTSASGVFGTMDASVINAGTLNAARIAAGSIAANRLVIGSGQNCLPDPAFAVAEITAARQSRSTGTWTVGAPAAGGIRSMSHLTTGTNDQFLYPPTAPATGTAGSGINVEPGQKWIMTVDVETDISAGVRWNIYRYNADGTVTYTALSGYNTAVGKRELSYTYTVPAGAIAMDLALACNTSGVNWTVYGNAMVALQASATLIEDGAIKTNHITVNTLNGDRITANTLNADRIVANSITGAKLSATAIDGKKITGAEIIGGEIATSETLNAVAARMGPLAVINPATGTLTAGIGFQKVGFQEGSSAGMFSHDGTSVGITENAPSGSGAKASIYIGSTKGKLNYVSIDGPNGIELNTANSNAEVKINGERQVIRHFTSVKTVSFPPSATAWGPGTLSRDASKSVNDDFISFPAADQFRLLERGVYSIHIAVANHTTQFSSARILLQNYNRTVTYNAVAKAEGEIWEFSLHMPNHFVASAETLSIVYAHNGAGSQEWDTIVRVTKLK